MHGSLLFSRLISNGKLEFLWSETRGWTGMNGFRCRQREAISSKWIYYLLLTKSFTGSKGKESLANHDDKVRPLIHEKLEFCSSLSILLSRPYFPAAIA